jgi:hypothetical protein
MLLRHGFREALPGLVGSIRWDAGPSGPLELIAPDVAAPSRAALMVMW